VDIVGPGGKILSRLDVRAREVQRLLHTQYDLLAR
jgi:hypothetical protein